MGRRFCTLASAGSDYLAQAKNALASGDRDGALKLFERAQRCFGQSTEPAIEAMFAKARHAVDRLTAGELPDPAWMTACMEDVAVRVMIEGKAFAEVGKLELSASRYAEAREIWRVSRASFAGTYAHKCTLMIRGIANLTAKPTVVSTTPDVTPEEYGEAARVQDEVLNKTGTGQ